MILCVIFAATTLLSNASKDLEDEEFVGLKKEVIADDDNPWSPKVEDVKLNLKDKTIVFDIPEPKSDNYLLEIFFISIFAIYAINYFIGRSKNDKIAGSWIKSVDEFLASNFTQYGNGQIVKESQSLYKVVGTGRQNIIGMQANLELKKRHDLYNMLLELVWKATDVLNIDVALQDDKMEPFVFAIVKKKEEKKFYKAHSDVSQVITQLGSANLNGLNPHFAVLTESDEVTQLILSKPVVQTLNNNQDLVNEIYFTDNSLLTPKYKKVLHFSYKVPTDGDFSKLLILTKMSLHLVDQVAAIQLSKNTKLKAEKNRVKMNEELEKQKVAERQEAAQQRKFDKLQKQKANLSGEELERFEEKEAKRAMKKRQGKMMKVVM